MRDVPLNADRVASHLQTRWLGRNNLRIETEVDSTNAMALRLLERGVAHGTVIAAEYQTTGRGRAGRRWASPARRNLLFSVLIVPAHESAPLSLYSLAAALAVCAAVRAETAVTPAVKWPNDIVIEGRKLGGILSEVGRSSDKRPGLVIGTGLNVNLDRDELAGLEAENPTSIEVESGQVTDRSPLLARCLLELERRAMPLLRNEPKPVVEEWREQTETLGRQVAVEFAGRQVVGYAEDIAEDGSLWVRPAQGTPVKISPAEVRHLR